MIDAKASKKERAAQALAAAQDIAELGASLDPAKSEAIYACAVAQCLIRAGLLSEEKQPRPAAADR